MSSANNNLISYLPNTWFSSEKSNIENPNHDCMDLCWKFIAVPRFSPLQNYIESNSTNITFESFQQEMKSKNIGDTLWNYTGLKSNKNEDKIYSK
ncbi:hypothetical protein BpHYR1_010738 [Brachionus plicatilis]|uniref:Uncharacterized protein n=1 Tax=Brachionus plicatilis TaxID=10195 RepID=A0A3M7SZA0_BRAPC|nr:hypothetical protein BpHYR1_010738 [Brachionus plicatilis]